MPDHDRGALTRIVKEWAAGPGSALIGTVVDSVIAHLARLEGEKPKRASLGELVEVLESCRGSGAQEFHEAAAVLRSVGEFVNDYRNAVTEAQGDEAAAKFLRSLP